jgi:hypothetical protein
VSQRELDLERALADLGAALEFPPTPDLAAAVATRLTGAVDSRRQRTSPSARLPRRHRWRRLAVAGMVAALLAAAVLVASPGTREAVARRLGLRGVDIRLGGEPPPTATTVRPGARLDLGLGERVTLEEAGRRVAFPLLVPGAAGFQRPDAVFVGPVPEGGRVDLVYRARPGLPASPSTDAGLLITQFLGQPTADFIKKVTGAGLVEQVTVGGEPGYWFSGEPHFFTYRDANGNFTEERTRLAGNTLIWQRGKLTLRLEGELSKQQAIRIAESMR